MTNFAPELFLRFMESKIVLSENTTYAKYFIGNSYLAQISEAQVSFANVTFERDAATTGISIKLITEVVRCLSA